ncbi:hypothetical protein FOA52_010978 [Chlamydomonas sp. UWO 241]|nr:hypothetical protein FOA52_010978 [Chlamydomonas sp. UWO 241]
MAHGARMAAGGSTMPGPGSGSTGARMAAGGGSGTPGGSSKESKPLHVPDASGFTKAQLDCLTSQTLVFRELKEGERVAASDLGPGVKPLPLPPHLLTPHTALAALRRGHGPLFAIAAPGAVQRPRAVNPSGPTHDVPDMMVLEYPRQVQAVTMPQACAQEEAAGADEAQVTRIQDLPDQLLLIVLVRAGAWPDVEGQPLGRCNRDMAHTAAAIAATSSAVERRRLRLLQQLDDGTMCVVCMDVARSVTLMPCGHRVLCEGCCSSVHVSNGECPMCRTPIEGAYAEWSRVERQGLGECLTLSKNVTVVGRAPGSNTTYPVVHMGWLRRLRLLDSTNMWETLPGAVMDECLMMHNTILRRCLSEYHGTESATEGDAFIMAFHTATDAVSFCLAVQEQLMAAEWPAELLAHASAYEATDSDEEEGDAMLMNCPWLEHLRNGWLLRVGAKTYTTTHEESFVNARARIGTSHELQLELLANETNEMTLFRGLCVRMGVHSGVTAAKPRKTSHVLFIPVAAATRLIAGRGSEGQMARDGIVRGALRDASYLGSTRHVRRLFSDCYGSEESAVAAAAVRVAAAAADGVSLPVCLAMNLVRFVHDVSGRDRPAGGGVVSASFLNAKPAVGGIGVEPRRGGVLRVLFTVASDAVADTVVRSRRNLRDVDPSAAVFDVLSDREEAQHRALWPAFLAAKAAGKRAQFHRARLVVDGERVRTSRCDPEAFESVDTANYVEDISQDAVAAQIEIDFPSSPPPPRPGAPPAQPPVKVIAPVVVSCVALLLIVFFSGWWYRRRRQALPLHLTFMQPHPGPDTTLVLTDIQDSTNMWETLPGNVMDECLVMHNTILRRCLSEYHGTESATEGDAFIMAFHTATDAVSFCLAVQEQLMAAEWPAALLAHASACEVFATPTRQLRLNFGTEEASTKPGAGVYIRFADRHIGTSHDLLPKPLANETNEMTLFRGLRVRMGVHSGVTAADISQNKASARTQYGGLSLSCARDVCNATPGGAVLLSRAAFLAVTTKGRRVPGAVMAHVGDFRTEGIPII